jgi:hypothetical protein
MRSFQRRRNGHKAVKALVHGIRPLALKQLIKTQLDLDHKHLRKSVLSFFDFVKKELRHHLKLARTGSLSGLVKVEPKRSASSPTEAGGTGRQRQLKPAGHVAAVRRYPRAQKPGSKVSRSNGAEGGAPRKMSCWGCKGAHSLRDYTATSEADKKAILHRVSAARTDGGRLEANKHATVSQKALSAPPSAAAGKVGAGQCVATIPGIDLGTDQHALLDSGGESPGVAHAAYTTCWSGSPRGRGAPRSWHDTKSGRCSAMCRSSSTGTS